MPVPLLAPTPTKKLLPPCTALALQNPSALALSKERLAHQFIRAMKLDGMGGFKYQAHYFFHPIIGDMYLREWGGIMADYMNAKAKRGEPHYSYVDFAWTGLEEFSSPFKKAIPLSAGRRE